MKRKTESTAASHIETCGTLLLSFSLIGGLVLIVLGFEGSSWLLIPGIGACFLGYFTYWLMRGLAEICEEIVLIRVKLTQPFQFHHISKDEETQKEDQEQPK